MTVELVLNTKCVIGEGPSWDERTQTIYFIDLLGNEIFSYDGRETKRMRLDENIGTAVVREKGGLMAATLTGYHAVDFPDGESVKLIDPEENRENSRFNDGKCDAKGRFWAGTMSRSLDSGYGEARPESALWCLETDGSVHKKLDHVIQGNGMAWTADNKKMYFIDSQTYTVQEFDFDLEKGELSNGHVVVSVPKRKGLPDGMTVDEEGMIWVALWGGGAVTRWNPETGELLQTIQLPAKNVTACTFGGKDMDELFVTTAALDTNEKEYPYAGGLFKIKLPVKGVPSYRYKG